MSHSSPTEEKNWKKITLTPIKESEDGSNNFPEFKRKSTLDMSAAGYIKYVDGEDYHPPTILVLQEAFQVTGVDANGNPATITIPGNAEEVRQAKTAATSWLEGDKKALAIIVKAVPSDRMYLVSRCDTAHNAWVALCEEFEPANKRIAIQIHQSIISNRCSPGDDPVQWRKTMAQLYSKLCEVDPFMMPDSQFSKHLITLMTASDEWRYCRDSLEDMLSRSEQSGGSMLRSKEVLQKLRNEEVSKGLAASVVEINAIIAGGRRSGKAKESDPLSVPMIAQSSTNPQKTLKDRISGGNAPRDSRCQDRRYTPYPQSNVSNNSSSSYSTASASSSNSKMNRNIICENTWCESPSDHTKATCFFYGGGSAGKYPDTWRGRKDIYLPPEE